jgi:hypothetical protein
VDLGGGVSAHPACPIELPAHWREWLGTLQAEVITGANLLIAIEMPSQTPTILDAETQLLDRRLTAMWRGLSLQGVPTYQQAKILLGGVDDRGETSVRRVSTPVTAYRHQFGESLDVSSTVLASAKRFADRIDHVYGAVPDFRRVRAGFTALNKGIEEHTAAERLHQFVRAMDGLMKLPQGAGRREFTNRGPTFVTGTGLNGILEQLYLLRNTQEHLNEFRAVIPAPTQREFDRITSLRAYQAEQAALASYRRLFDGGPLNDFLTEASIDAFWRLDEAERRRRWGAAFDLDAAAVEHERLFALLYDRP